MTATPLIAALFAIEATGVACLLGGASIGLAGFFAAHLLASALALQLSELVPSPDSPGRRSLNRLPMFALVLAIPVFGLLGAVLAVVPALRRPRRRARQTWLRVAIPPLPPSPVGVSSDRESVNCQRSLLEQLAPERSIDDRVAAVMAVRVLPTRAALPILRVALRDPVDDVRLLAYAMLDRRDAELQGRIERLVSELADPELSPTGAASRHHALAQLYWEQVHAGLATGAVGDRALDRADHHARSAVELAADLTDTGAAVELAGYFLGGRIALRRGELARAEAMFLAAEDRGFAASSTRPFLAEIAFLRRDFGATRQHLHAVHHATAHRASPIAAVSQYWLPEVRA